MDNGEIPRIDALPCKISRPPESLVFDSLANLYQQYLDLFVGKNFQCPRGTQIVFERDNFFHLVKLEKDGRVSFEIAVEESLIMATVNDFGNYIINVRRAETLSWIPEILTAPHEIWEYEERKTANEVFIREYDKPGSPFRVVLLMREGGHLTPITCMTVRRTGIKEHRKGRKLWPT